MATWIISLTDPTCKGYQTVKNKQNKDGMACKAKKFRAVALVCGQLFNGLCVIINFFNGTQVKGSYSIWEPFFIRPLSFIFFSFTNERERRMERGETRVTERVTPIAQFLCFCL